MSNTGITNINATDINIYPDPTTDKLYISNLSQSAILTISDMTGRVCLTPISSQQTAGVVSLDVSALPAGVYCLHIQDSGGSVVRKFVKE